MSKHYLKQLSKITTLMFDVDGVLTDGMVILMPNGEPVRSLNSKDGFAIQLAVKKGYRVCIITGGHSESVKKRLEFMGVKDVYLRVFNKIDTYDDIKVMYDLEDEEIMYMGDDLVMLTTSRHHDNDITEPLGLFVHSCILIISILILILILIF